MTARPPSYTLSDTLFPCTTLVRSATFWGGNLQTVRSWLAPTTQRQDWTTGSADEARRAIAQNTQPEPEHAGHNAAGHDMNMHGLHGAHDIDRKSTRLNSRH